MGVRRVPWLAIAFAVVASCTPALHDDVYSCTDDASCPTGFNCVAGFCRNTMGGECRQDFQCDDRELCTADICENGYCEHEPADGAPCDDDQFCNGPEQCASGTCASLDMPPCDFCVEGTGCTDCGALGDNCCDGDFCFPGGACDGATCVPCGGPNEPCCISDVSACGSALICVFDRAPPRCLPCGQPGELCCDTGCNGDDFCDVVSAGMTMYPLCVDATCPVCPAGAVCIDIAIDMYDASCLPCGELDHPCCPTGQRCHTDDLFCTFGFCFSTSPKTGM